MLTFYTERLANESYLRTARERTSLQELGAAASATGCGRASPRRRMLAFALEPPPDAAARGDDQDPGSAPPVTPAASSTLEPGLRVQSIPGPGEQPQTFETVEEIEARPEWNALPVVRTARLGAGATAPRPGWRATRCA